MQSNPQRQKAGWAAWDRREGEVAERGHKETQG